MKTSSFLNKLNDRERKKRERNTTSRLYHRLMEIHLLLATGISIVDVFGADLIQAADELVERLAVNHQTSHAFGIVGNNVGRSYVFPVGVCQEYNNYINRYFGLESPSLSLFEADVLFKLLMSSHTQTHTHTRALSNKEFSYIYPWRAFSPKKSPRCSERMYSSCKFVGSLMVTFTCFQSNFIQITNRVERTTHQKMKKNENKRSKIKSKLSARLFSLFPHFKK